MTHPEISIAFDRKFRLGDANLILKDIYFIDKCGRQIDLTFIATVQRVPLLQNYGYKSKSYKLYI